MDSDRKLLPSYLEPEVGQKLIGICMVQVTVTVLVIVHLAKAICDN